PLPYPTPYRSRVPRQKSDRFPDGLSERGAPVRVRSWLALASASDLVLHRSPLKFLSRCPISLIRRHFKFHGWPFRLRSKSFANFHLRDSSELNSASAATLGKSRLSWVNPTR